MNIGSHMNLNNIENNNLEVTEKIIKKLPTKSIIYEIKLKYLQQKTRSDSSSKLVKETLVSQCREEI